jgi:hypothetical protein
MRRASVGLLVAVLAMFATPLAAQGAGRGVSEMRPGAGRPARGAEYFLAHTGELRLTDAQVVRLAAIARRSEDRRRAARARLDSIMPTRRPPTDSAGRAARMRDMEQMREQMRASIERQRDQARADLRDALAVLTPDQQVLAWEMVAAGPHRERGVRGARQREFRRGAPGMRAPRAAPRQPGSGQQG